jgi:hypothetical protein
MATVEALVRKRLLANNLLSEKLATFGGLPSIFFQEAPDDKDEAWGDAQYPRIVFLADTFSDPARDRRKVLSVDIMCTTTGTPPEDIEPLVRKSLAGVFFTPEDGETFSAKWKDTQVFKEAAGDREPLVVGMTLTFDIYEYPLLETCDPDPIAAMCSYVETWCGKFAVIGRTRLSGIYEPTREHPAIYFSRSGASVDRETNAVVWMNSEIVVHLFAPSLHDRIEWVEQFLQPLAFTGEITMLDESPMFIKQIRGDAAGDELTGQLRISVQYGLLRRSVYAHGIHTTSFR